MLRLTGEVLKGIVGYPLARNHNDSGGVNLDVVREVLDWLDDIDNAWVLILQGQIFDPTTKRGIDLLVDSSTPASTSDNVTQTERTRLRSLLVGGSAALEEWVQEVGDGGVLFDRLEEAGLREELDEIFMGTLREIGGLEGSIDLSDPDGMVGTC
jgi:hypothetical protein